MSGMQLYMDAIDVSRRHLVSRHMVHGTLAIEYRLPRRRNYALDCAVAHSHVCVVSRRCHIVTSFRQTVQKTQHCTKLLELFI